MQADLNVIFKKETKAYLIDVFKETKAYLIERIKYEQGLSFTKIYQLTFQRLQDHDLVKTFLIWQNYTNVEITRAKANLKFRGIFQ